MELAPYYKKLHYFEDKEQTLLLNEASDCVCLMKRITIGDKNVYSYLKDHEHPNLTKIFEIIDDEDCFYVIEEKIDGMTLEEWLDGGRSNREKLTVVDQLCSALAFLHDADPPIIHRDVKPSNIMITTTGAVKLIDYDASKYFKPGESRDTVLIGTKGAAAPEQYGFAQSDQRTDIYALGLIVKELFPGRYKNIIRKATDMNPEYRFRSIREFRLAFRNTHLPFIATAGVVSIAAALLFAFFIFRDTSLRNAAIADIKATVPDLITETSVETEGSTSNTTTEETSEASAISSSEASDMTDTSDVSETIISIEATAVASPDNDVDEEEDEEEEEEEEEETSDDHAPTPVPSSEGTATPSPTPSPTLSPSPTPSPEPTTTPPPTPTPTYQELHDMEVAEAMALIPDIVDEGLPQDYIDEHGFVDGMNANGEYYIYYSLRDMGYSEWTADEAYKNYLSSGHWEDVWENCAYVERTIIEENNLDIDEITLDDLYYGYMTQYDGEFFSWDTMLYAYNFYVKES